MKTAKQESDEWHGKEARGWSVENTQGTHTHTPRTGTPLSGVESLGVKARRLRRSPGPQNVSALSQLWVLRLCHSRSAEEPQRRSTTASSLLVQGGASAVPWPLNFRRRLYDVRPWTPCLGERGRGGRSPLSAGRCSLFQFAQRNVH